MRYAIFTDIHGCLVELQELMEVAGICDTDTLVFAGDLVDRGPHSAGVVKYVRSLTERQPTIYVRGNHDDKHCRYRRNLEQNPSAARSMRERKEELHTTTMSLSVEDKKFMDDSVLFYQIPEYDVLVVHAGIMPTLKSLPHNAKIRGDKYMSQMMYIRHVDADGHMKRLGDENPHDKFWADIYDGRFGTVFFGHQPFWQASEPVKFPHAIGLDLGCCFGNKLACAILSDEPVKFFTVDAKDAYAKVRHED